MTKSLTLCCVKSHSIPRQRLLVIAHRVCQRCQVRYAYLSARWSQPGKAALTKLHKLLVRDPSSTIYRRQPYTEGFNSTTLICYYHSVLDRFGTACSVLKRQPICWLLVSPIRVVVADCAVHAGLSRADRPHYTYRPPL